MRLLPRYIAGRTLLMGLLMTFDALLLIKAFYRRPETYEEVSDHKDPDIQTLDLTYNAQRQSNEIHSQDPIVDQPLFLVSRRPFMAPPLPPPPVSSKPPVQVSAPPAFIVEGIVMGTTLKKAYIRRAPDVGGRWVEIGQEVDGWTLVGIEESQVDLSKDDRHVIVSLYRTKTQR